ncbi:hypothetical protein [Paenibacillus illinoisensis]|uniref:hypothetical protein n=1 Tax=Paenibacillus illinoisensis TaxID=59845 RepID=UPI00203CCE4C|nr:hypothetical protein [Paenibacillus illinoisensis]MCM3203373.1 hypothetical protein [Paenibacillus illinoisensis]
MVLDKKYLWCKKRVDYSKGFKQNDQWIDMADAFDSGGAIIHRKGVSPVKGLYFIGLPWQTSRGSALLGWVRSDAQQIVNYIIQSEQSI